MVNPQPTPSSWGYLNSKASGQQNIVCVCAMVMISASEIMESIVIPSNVKDMQGTKIPLHHKSYKKWQSKPSSNDKLLVSVIYDIPFKLDQIE